MHSAFFQNKSNKQAGFTIIEVLIVIGILALLIGLGLFLSMDVYRGADFDSERDKIISILHRARTRALSNINQLPHGVHFESDKYVVFEGATFDSTDPDNENFPASGITTHNPVSLDIVFSQITGNSSYSSTITLSGQGRTATISFNNEGRINW